MAVSRTRARAPILSHFDSFHADIGDDIGDDNGDDNGDDVDDEPNNDDFCVIATIYEDARIVKDAVLWISHKIC